MSHSAEAAWFDPFPELKTLPATGTSPPFSDRRSVRSDMRYRILRRLQQDPSLSQRALARDLGMSLGSVHYCLRALIEKGMVKAKRFAASPRKQAYAYVLTPKGLAAKTALTGDFLLRKRAEYEALKEEIADLEAELENDK